MMYKVSRPKCDCDWGVSTELDVLARNLGNLRSFELQLTPHSDPLTTVSNLS
jgi:hypothetical protein